jgi:8-oxo-dGTP diphosphatase
VTVESRDVPVWDRDPEAYQAYLAEGNAKQPRKRVAADVILRDDLGRVLLVHPTYKPGWDTPGGMVEANEPPDAAAGRELREELGLDIAIGRPLVIDWVPPHGPWDDMVAFVFDAGTLAADQATALALDDGELDGFEFVVPAEALQRLSERTRRRLDAALDALATGSVFYLRDGERA